MKELRLGVLSAVVVTLIVVGASVGLWLALPLAWLYLGSQIQAVTGSLAGALGAAMLGFVACVVAALLALGWLSRKHGELREARGRDNHGRVLLEGVIFLSAFAAVALFSLWFLLFSGSSPIPFAPGG
ncbi:MAG TPA: hypothetical protein VGR12_03535 [Solirubrobacteraceae bacterium]|nr:hypothetical protein [Solirubrobacteraceae bacterium]